MTPIPSKQTTAAASPETIEQRFCRLAESWETAVAHHSSSSIRENHAAYREIVDLGPPVVSVLLRDLESTHRHWFRALEEITGADPILESDAGNVPKMVKAWVAWGKDHGYKW